MKTIEIDKLFKIAGEFAEKWYRETYDTNPDISNPATQQILDDMMQAWLSGYNFLCQDTNLQNSIEQIFSLYVNMNLIYNSMIYSHNNQQNSQQTSCIDCPFNGQDCVYCKNCPYEQ